MPGNCIWKLKPRIGLFTPGPLPRPKSFRRRPEGRFTGTVYWDFRRPNTTVLAGKAAAILPARVLGRAAHYRQAAGFVVGTQTGAVLHNHVNIPKAPLQSIALMNGVGARGVE